MFAASKTAAVSSAANYIEDVFSTYLYTGDNTNPTVVTNNIDLSGKGGLVWLKGRSGSFSTDRHELNTTNFSVGQYLSSNNTFALSSGGALTTYSNNGFTLGAAQRLSFGGGNYVSWTFRKQPKFFDIVTFSGNATAGRAISHNLGSVPGCIIVKKTSGSDYWAVYHRSTGTAAVAELNTTNAFYTGVTNIWGSGSGTTPTSTEFYLGSDSAVNGSGSTYVAYLFAHNAGGFGLTGTDNVISCGSFTTDGSGAASVTLGYEPQWVLYKKTSSGAEDWYLFDNMRGIPTGSADAQLNPNLSAAEASSFNYINLSATGFDVLNQSSSATYIYIAIRRGPMKVPTSGTSVFSPVAQTGNGTSNTVTTGFPTDLVIGGSRTANPILGVVDRLRGRTVTLQTASTAAEDTSSSTQDLTSFASNTSYTLGTPWAASFNYSGADIYWNFRRAPSFFDEVCYTGTGSATTFSHNLGAVPEMMIGKSRSGTFDWCVYHKDIGNTKAIYLNRSGTPVTSLDFWNNTTPTSSVFTIGTINRLNTSGNTQVMYLFATCAGVSKVGSYTGTGALQTINCGFTSGARFVLIKQTNDINDWYVYDTARGMTSGNDPYLTLNTTDAEVTSTNFVDTDSTGFKVTAAASATINVNGGTYIFLAIA